MEEPVITIKNDLYHGSYNCPICLEEMEGIIVSHTSCGHDFCKFCLDCSFVNKKLNKRNCPICRRSLATASSHVPIPIVESDEDTDDDDDDDYYDYYDGSEDDEEDESDDESGDESYDDDYDDDYFEDESDESDYGENMYDIYEDSNSLFNEANNLSLKNNTYYNNGYPGSIIGLSPIRLSPFSYVSKLNLNLSINPNEFSNLNIIEEFYTKSDKIILSNLDKI